MNVNCRESFDLTLATAPGQNGKVGGARSQRHARLPILGGLTLHGLA